jgi:hypothetical protein
MNLKNPAKQYLLYRFGRVITREIVKKNTKYDSQKATCLAVHLVIYSVASLCRIVKEAKNKTKSLLVKIAVRSLSTEITLVSRC